MSTLRYWLNLCLLLGVLAACGQDAPAGPTAFPSPSPAATPTPAALQTAVLPIDPPIYTYEIINVYPHDPAAFTQGLVYLDGILYEGTGLYGRSSIRQTNLETGEVLLQRDLSPDYFGEGIAIWQDRLIQITWQSGVGFVYDRANFEPRRSFSYPGEGWGLTHDGQRLMMSDGTNEIRFLDPESLAENGRIQVTDANGPITRLNELEYVNGEIWANIWQTNRVARIAPDTGQVIGWIDLTGLLDPASLTQPIDVLNGIAYDAAQDRLFVTGKLWPSLFEIKLVPATNP
ncbi:MAG: glutaminyl-peptide cyclotransferase [Chloroflexi bacterium]|nr:glutaminyl-peptide cyclotransferase [Chloroflexota bacterium]